MSKPAMHNTEAATMTVTVAVEEARKRGAMSQRDLRHMSAAERSAYAELCPKEWGVMVWEPEE